VAHTLVEKLRERRKVGLINSDSFYWEIAGREPNPDIMYEGLRRLTDLYLSHGYDFVVEGMLIRAKQGGGLRVDDIVATARQYNADVRMFHLTAPIDVLRKREKAKFLANGWTFDEADFQDWYDRSEKHRLEGEVEISTLNKSADDVVKEIMEKL
jgi:hypothetical protein